MTGPFCVEARGLRKVFRVRRSHRVVTALNGIDLVVPSGALVALVGPDGAGKTTFMRMVCGFLAPDGGSLNVLGADIAREPEPAQANIGYMPQRFGLYEDLTVRENLELYSDLYGVSRTERDERLPHLLAMTELARFETRPAGQLSGGMKQKLGLACALARSPELLLLDEPSVGVDPLSRQELWDVLLGLVREEHLSVMVSTAYMDEAERCDFVYVLDNGAVLAHGAPANCVPRRRTLLPHPARSGPARQDRTSPACPMIPPLWRTPCPRGERCVSSSTQAPPQPKEAGVPGETAEEEARRCGGLDAVPAPARLEDGFMTILREQRKALARKPDETEIPQEESAALSSYDKFQPETGRNAEPEVVIEVRDLVRRFGSFVAVDNTSFTVGRGEVFSLLGPTAPERPPHSACCVACFPRAAAR